MIFVDTDVLVDILRNRAAATAWLNAQTELIAASGFSCFELIDGTESSADLRATRKLMQRLDVHWLSAAHCEVAMATFQSVHLGNAIGIVDMLIAQTAISLGVPLHTFNTKHYAAVPDLQTIQPYTR